ncbi:MAG: carbamoyltransferase N-terminal domain-containing protein [Acidimicrobiia bacterium]|nr:carbamoyltransferase N-terminal domain-containing protein [Acidimicrobiia bacterium]
MSRLLLSLGHNSSAVLIRNGRVVAGFEEERLTKKKSDSSFPRCSIEQLKHLHPEVFKNITNVYISHWFVDGTLPEIHDKYFDPLYFHFHLPDAKIHSVSMDFTHHDAHAWSATAFAGSEFPTNDTLVLVADGFGNFGETMSLYWLDSHYEPKLIRRSFGYESSLGLMYQYATAYLGMKENQDEYKLLGYEAHVHEYLIEEEMEIIGELAEYNAEQHLEIIRSRDTVDRYDPLLALDALPALRVQYGIHFEKILNKLGVSDQYSQEAKRAIIAYYVQSRLEHTVKSIVKDLSPENLIVVGGLFMNVKLNNELTRSIPGSFCVMPLAGDQGAPIGLYQAMEKDFVWPNNLFWGTREFYTMDCDRLHFFMENEPSEYEAFILSLLQQDYIVNVVKGPMEFGARALGNTTSLARPSEKNVQYINSLNGRSTIMPMAPIVTRRESTRLFEDIVRVHKSLEYMICTRDYRIMDDSYRGAAHNTPDYHPDNPTGFTGRPQVIDFDHWLHPILTHMPNEMLINTSFNEHGMPICYSMQDVLRCHQYQLSNDSEQRVYTVVIA